MGKVVCAGLEVSLAPAGAAQLKWGLDGTAWLMSCSCVPAPQEKAARVFRMEMEMLLSFPGG